ncbi:MAG: tyrosine--tRNA ligase, partial [Sphingomonadales bacterium]
LADEATALCRGAAAAQAAADTAKKLFEQGSAGGDLPQADVPQGTPVVDAFVALGLAKSKGEARRLIRQGGGRLNDVAISAEDLALTADQLEDGKIKLSAGKKRHGLVTLS